MSEFVSSMNDCICLGMYLFNCDSNINYRTVWYEILLHKAVWRGHSEKKVVFQSDIHDTIPKNLDSTARSAERGDL